MKRLPFTLIERPAVIVVAALLATDPLWRHGG
jgi:hypothetical protein